MDECVQSVVDQTYENIEIILVVSSLSVDSASHIKIIKAADTIVSCTCKIKVDTHKSVGVYFFRSIMGLERM